MTAFLLFDGENISSLKAITFDVMIPSLKMTMRNICKSIFNNNSDHV